MSLRRSFTTLGVMALLGVLLSRLGSGLADLSALRSPQQVVDTQGSDQLLLLASTAAAWLVWAWGSLGLLLTVLGTLPGAVGQAAMALQRVALPAGARHAAAAMLGLALTATGPALASAAVAHPPVSVVSASAQTSGSLTTTSLTTAATSTQIGSGAVPDWPSTSTDVSGAPDWPGATAGDHVVLRGDCLWDIATAWLSARDGGEPSDAQVAAAVQAWWTANADVIGEDPDLLLPGQVLVPPA